MTVDWTMILGLENNILDVWRHLYKVPIITLTVKEAFTAGMVTSESHEASRVGKSHRDIVSSFIKPLTAVDVGMAGGRNQNKVYGRLP